MSKLLASLCLMTMTVAPAWSESRPRSSGLYAEAGVGARGYLADASEHSAIGPKMSLHMGIDIVSWLSIGGRIAVSSHEATVPAPPVGEYYQLYGVGAEARISIPAGRLGLFADGSAGVGLVSTNVLEKVSILDPGERLTPKFSAGGGIEYQLQNRHYAVGIGGEYTLLPAFAASSSVSARAFLRYTY